MNPNDELNRFWKAIEVNSNRIDQMEIELHQTVTNAVKAAMPNAILSDEEYRWVQLAIRRQAQSIAWRQSVIDKSLTALVFSLLGGLVLIIKEYFSNHGWKP